MLQTEYVTWSRVDKHARAFLILANAQSKRIAQKLSASATRPRRSSASTATPTTCRWPSAASASGSRTACRAKRATVRPAAGSRSTPRTRATHEKNVANGLYDLADPAARARLCLSCHFGNADRFVTHRLMASGHPRMSFELDTFTAVGPAHFKPDSRLRKAQARLGRRAGLGDRPGDGRVGADGGPRRSEAQPRRAVPGARPVRLPRLPSPDERQALDAARARASGPAPCGSTTRRC